MLYLVLATSLRMRSHVRGALYYILYLLLLHALLSVLAASLRMLVRGALQSK